MGLVLQKYENMPTGSHAGAITTAQHSQYRLRMAETSDNIFPCLPLPSPFRK
jgi:hypothetical protein